MSGVENTRCCTKETNKKHNKKTNNNNNKKEHKRTQAQAVDTRWQKHENISYVDSCFVV